MDISYYKKYEPIFGAWYIKELIGEGSYGQVYVVERQEFGRTYQSALKAITVPQSKSEIKSMMSEGMSVSDTTSYYETVVKSIIDECKLMSDLKGISNIVSYEDHVVVPHDDGIGYDILIRMELLTPLLDHTYQRTLAEEEVIRLGIDLCKALEICEKNKIIHRDIKPENIFISANGDYKLGDFGIARTLEKTAGGLSKKGTYAYMAPEVYKGEPYGPSVDIYSLGIVLYRLLNNNRTPFLPPFPERITHDMKESAIRKRIMGHPITPIENANPTLSDVVLKACAYNPGSRYRSAMEFRSALVRCALTDDLIKSTEADEAHRLVEEEQTVDIERAQPIGGCDDSAKNSTDYGDDSVGRNVLPTKMIAIIAAAIVLVAATIVIGLVMYLSNSNDTSAAEDIEVAEDTETVQPESDKKQDQSVESNGSNTKNNGNADEYGEISYGDEPVSGYGDLKRLCYNCSDYDKGIAILHEPNIDAEIVERIPQYTEFYVGSHYEGYYYVEGEDFSGWMNEKYIGHIDHPDEYASSEYVDTYGYIDHNLKKGIVIHPSPHLNTDAIDRVPFEEEIKIMYTYENYGYIDYCGTYGWLNLKYVSW